MKLEFKSAGPLPHGLGSRFKLILLAWSFLCLGVTATAQGNDSLGGSLTLSTFIETYYGYDFSQNLGGNRPGFIYNYDRNQEVNLNLGYLKTEWRRTRYWASMALQAGTYVQSNYASEPAALRMVHEAQVGVSLDSAGKWWVEGGIMPSHIGFESAASLDNWTLSRSILAENSPYYMSGVKLRHAATGKISYGISLLNGWQRIRKLRGSRYPSLGTQFSYAPSDRLTLNWSTFFGTDENRLTSGMRYFSNLYGIWRISERTGLIAGWDIGFQQQGAAQNDYAFWMSPVLILRQTVGKRWAMAVRGEYYADGQGVMLPYATEIAGFSANVDFKPFQGMLARVEGRMFQASDPVFTQGGNRVRQNFAVNASLAVALQQTWKTN